MLKLVKLVILIAVISGVIFWWQYSSFKNTPVVSEETQISVTSGGFQKLLIDNGLNPFFARMYLSQNTPDFELQKGNYIIPENAGIAEFIESFKTPINQDDELLTILEGWNIYDIDRTLSQKELITQGEFINYVTDCEYFCTQKNTFAFISDAETLEGFLYPDSYAINPNNFTIENLVTRMLENFRAKVIDSGIISDMGSIEILDIINMASIVQKEVTFQGKSNEEIYEEASTVAGVLLKRAREGWYIGADATVCYAHELPTQDCTPTAVLTHLYDRNEYNTRQMVGMPRGPIANAEARIIDAVMRPTESPHYYYLHAPNGQIYYGRTNADHEENKRRYLR